MMSTTTTTIKIVSKKMIKPCTPTPQNLKNYKISFTDQSVPPMNIPIILFYSPPPSTDLISHLENSLSTILPRFYPLAGRYIREDHSVLCNDEGVEFVEAHACSDSFRNISEYVESGAHEQLNGMLLPRLPHQVDEFTDPMVSIQVTRFGCGGVAIGLSVSHRIVDADSISTFVRAWAEDAKNNPCLVNPSFDSPALLPFKNLLSPAGSESIQLPITVDPNITTRRFLFDKDTISTLKAKVRDRSRRVSKVGVVCALISEAVIHAHQLKHERSGNIVIVQAVNIRDRTIPPFPKHTCGNLVAMATRKLCPSNDSVDGDDDRKLIKVGFEDLVSLLRDAIDETIADCASLFDDGGLNILYGSRMEMIQEIASNGEENKLLALSDWSKFEYYEADFGWGKPTWTSSESLPLNDFVILMGNKDGDGIEAWVRMSEEDMALFEQEIIKIYNKPASA